MKYAIPLGTAATWLVCVTTACSAGQPPASSPTTSVAPSPEPGVSTTARSDRETTVRLSDDLIRECRIPGNPSELPRFELDQSTLRAPGKNVLDDLANCMKEGPLQYRTITVIGRADPRGTEAHNHELGADRAEAARTYLIAKGVPENKILVTSRGEEGAAGDGEDAWSVQRRVDLVLGDRTQRTSINQNPPANSNANAAPNSPGSSYADQSEGGPASGKVQGTSGPGSDSVPGK